MREKKWLSQKEHDQLIAGVDAELEADRDFAVASPLPSPESAAGGTYCQPGCHEIRPKYGMPKTKTGKAPAVRRTEAAVHLK